MLHPTDTIGTSLKAWTVMFTSVPRDPVDNLMMTVFMRSPRQSCRDMLTSTSKMLWERVLLPSVPLPPGYVDTPLWGFVEASVSPCGRISKSIRKWLACIFCSGCCCKGRKRSRNRAPPGSGASTLRHENSETESEAEDETSCQAESVAFLLNGKTTP